MKVLLHTDNGARDDKVEQFGGSLDLLELLRFGTITMRKGVWGEIS